MKFINLSNIKVENENIEFEFLYKSDCLDNQMLIYFEDTNQRKYTCKVNTCRNKITYSYHNEECFITKASINIPILEYGALKMFLKDSKGLSELKIRDNRNELITEKENPYMIFTPQYKVQILENGFKITKRKMGNKFKYELKKQIYGLKKYHKIFIFRFLKAKTQKYYLFNDRLLYGDDNAEELFKYINQKHPKFAKRCYFVLDKKSNSFKRIRKEGKVLKYESFRHKLKFLNSRIILSSHASYLSNCFNPFQEDEMDLYKDLIQKKFVFLQHGVIMNDVREFLNRELITADLFITSAKKEYEYIRSEDFMYEPDMVIGTGLPRFDKLKNGHTKPIILISPTWRALKEGIRFEESEYFIAFKNLLLDQRLIEILEKNQFKVKFLLHPVFAKYKELFDEISTEHIEILDSSQIKYFELFNECSIFITDYSSIHYDVAFEKKPIIYYQFDKEYFFQNHYKAGYFNYEADGFGKVVETKERLIDEIEYYINNKCKIREEYKDRIEDTFIYLDHHNSERVFHKVMELDKHKDINYRFNNVH